LADATAAEASPRAPRRLVVLGAGPAQLGLLAAARKRDLFVIAVDRDPAAPGFRYADRRAIVSTEDEPGIERLARAERVDGIVAPGIDWPVGIAARVAERLSLRHPVTPETAVLTTSKLRQRARFEEAGVPQPDFEICSDAGEAADAALRLGFPCVVKATDRQGQRGLSLVRTQEELPGAVEAALAEARSQTVLVEELIPGREVTVNAFSAGGRFHPLTVTDREVAEPPAFGVALAHAWPSALEPPSVGAAVDAARRAATALGIREGPTYTQVLVGEDGGARVGELAARVGGGHDAELCRVALGVDLNGVTIAAALGDLVTPQMLAPRTRVGGACVRFLVPPQGELVRVAGMEEAFELPGIKGIRLYRRSGHHFGPFRRGADRAGAILAVGESRDEALANAARAAELVRFETAPSEVLA
jgi:biotin carboxylase